MAPPTASLLATPTPSAGQTQDWAGTFDEPFGPTDAGADGGHGTAGTVTRDFTNSYDDWYAAAVAVRGA